MGDTEESDQKRAWKVELVDLYRGTYAPNNIYLKWSRVVRRPEYLKEVTEQEMDDLFSLAIQHGNEELFEDNNALGSIDFHRERATNLPRMIQKIQEYCDRFNPPSSFIAKLTQFFQLDRTDTCNVLSRSFIERMIVAPPRMSTTAFIAPLLNRVVEFGSDVTNRFLATMSQVQMICTFVNYLKQILLDPSITEASMDAIWNYLLNQTDRPISLCVYCNSPPRHVAKIIDRLTQDNNPKLVGFRIGFAIPTTTYLFELLVAGLKADRLRHACIHWGLCGSSSNLILEAETAYRTVAGQLTGRVSKDLTWLIFQYLV